MANTESEKVIEFLHEIQLEQFYRQIVDQLHVTRLNHFAHVTEQDLDSLGLSKPEQRRLFEALKKSKKKLLFGSFRRKKSKTKLISSEPDNDEPTRPSIPLNFKPVDAPSPPQPSSSLTCVIDEKDLVLCEMLGTGAFGYVRKGEWLAEKNNKVDVAVKCLKISKDSAFLQLQLDFSKEANGMSRLDHRHIIKLYGVVLSSPLMLVTELAPQGCLLTSLRNENPKFLISELSDFVVQVASGMAYLEKAHYIHRDLAARNLLLSSRDTVKIGDFGLMRPLGTEEDYYTMNPKGKVPFAWCPPESLKFRKFSHASDVWSFGILLMELFSYGEEPWPGLTCTQILQKVDMPNLERPQKPSHCPSKIYNVVLHHCWAHDPAHRPTFAALQNIMEQIHPEDLKAERTFESQIPQNLPFIEGDNITLIEASPDASWWRGQNKRTGRVGMFPSEMIDSPSSSSAVSRSASFAKRVAKSPVTCITEKQNCDCAEEHFYDFPFIINPHIRATSPTRSRNSDFTCSTESGYSSSFTPSITKSFHRDSNVTYENFIGFSNYELMESKIRTKPARQAPSPHENRNYVRQFDVEVLATKDDHGVCARDQVKNRTFEKNMHEGRNNKTPVSIPERKDSLLDKRFSDLIIQDSVLSGLSGSTAPHENSTVKRLSGDSTTLGNTPKHVSGSASTTPEDNATKHITGDAHTMNNATKLLSDKLPTQEITQKDLTGDSIPENCPNCITDNNTAQGGVPKNSDKPRSTGPFILSRRVSAKKLKSFDIPLKRSDSLNSQSGNDVCNSPSNQSPFSSRPNSRTSIGSLSPGGSSVPRPKSGIPEDSHRAHPRNAAFSRSCSSDAFNSKSLREAQQFIKSPSPTDQPTIKEINSNGISSRVERSYSFGSVSNSLRESNRRELCENRDSIPRCKTVSGATAHDNRSLHRGAFYENHEMIQAMDVARRLLSSEDNVPKEDQSCVKHKLHYEPNFSDKVPNHSVPQGYETMAFRKSYTENNQNMKDSKSSDVAGKPKSASYENYSVGAIKNSQVLYENFVIVEHSDVPEEIGAMTNLKCPSYENHGFEKLGTKAENELKETDIIDNVFQEYSSSVPNSENWRVFHKDLDKSGSLVTKMGRSVTPILRRSSSDGDLRDEEESNSNSHATSSYGTKEIRQVRCSFDITGELASNFSNHMKIKEHVTISNDKIKIVDARIETTFRSPKESNGSDLKSKTLACKDLGNPNKFTRDEEYGEQDTSLINEMCEIVPADIPPPLPERKKQSLKQITDNECAKSSYENVKKDTSLPQGMELAVATEPLLANATCNVEESHAGQPRPNVLSFENKLAAFISPHLPKKERVEPEDDAPKLPPKARSRSLPRQEKSTSNYPRLSRDSSDLKLNFVEDANRYRPCPSKRAPYYEYPKKHVSSGDGKPPPPLPKKMSKPNISDIAA